MKGRLKTQFSDGLLVHFGKAGVAGYSLLLNYLNQPRTRSKPPKLMQASALAWVFGLAW